MCTCMSRPIQDTFRYFTFLHSNSASHSQWGLSQLSLQWKFHCFTINKMYLNASELGK